MSRLIFSQKSLHFAVLSTIFILLVGAIFNYTQPYDPDPVAAPAFPLLLLWGSLYAPLVIFPLAAHWPVTGFGFQVNRYLPLATILLTGTCLSISVQIHITWTGAIWEAFARTGEELFFRGFLFLLLTKIFQGMRRPWLWAVIGSSLAFTLVHTQTFQSSYFSPDSSMPWVYLVVERLVNVFLLGAFLALVRQGTGSILPGALVHGMTTGGAQILPFSLLIYALITLWAVARGEQILVGFKPVGKFA